MFLCLLACQPVAWKSVRAEKPATRAELAAWPVSVKDPVYRAAMTRAGFNAVERPPYRKELELSIAGDLATLRSDGFFVDEVRGTPDRIAEDLAASERVADFVRNSGLPQQQEIPNH